MPTATITATQLGLPAPLQKGEVSLSFDTPGPSKARSASNVLKSAADGTTPPANPDEGSIYYINAIPDIPEASSQLESRQQDTELASSFWSAKATESADLKIKEGKLSTAQDGDSIIKKTNYRIQVIEHAIQHSGWMSQVATQNASKKFSVRKDQLHAEILKTVLSGLLLPPNVYDNFEKIVTSIGDSLKNTKEHSAKQNKWILLTTYRYDSVQKKIFAAMRTIYFSVTQELVDYKNSKNDKGTDAKIELLYKQDDYSFNETVWVGLKGKVKEYVDKNGVPIDIIDIPV